MIHEATRNSTNKFPILSCCFAWLRGTLIARVPVLLTLLTIALACAPASLRAQQQPQRGRTRQQTTKPPAAQSKDDAAKRRAQAVDLLNETAYAARLLDDLDYRARIQALAADALWSSDEQGARALFRRAWDSATAADKAEQKATEDEGGQASSSEEAFVGDARDELLIKVAARDPQLANLFLQEYLKDRYADQSESQTESQQQRRTPWRRLTPASQRRLALAYNLLYNDEPERAAQIAAPVAGEGVTGDLMEFTLHLLDQSPAQADTFYVNLLKRTRTDATADANSVLMLSSPLISPQLLVVVDNDGSLEFRTITLQNEPLKWPPPSDMLRRLFYDVAATILARPVVPRPEANPARVAVALYFTINRLLPYFEREARQYAPEMQARQGALANEIEASRRERLTAQAGLTSLTPERADDPLKPQVEKLSRVSDDDTGRNGALLTLVKLSVKNRLWDRARRFAAEIKDQKTQHAALTLIAVGQIADITRAYANDKEGEFEYLATFIRGADVPPFAAAWGLAQTALIATRAKDKAQAAAELLDEAERYAARIEMGTHTRVAAYAALTTYAVRVDQPRAWRLLSETVKAANDAKDYVGDESSIELGADENASEDAEDSFTIASDDFRLDRIFATMSRLDFEKALVEARGLRGKIPQALAQIAAARATLERK